MAFKHTACFVVTVMIVCNAVLYPSIFSTMFRQWFGSSKQDKKEGEPQSYDTPPHLRHGGRGAGPARPRTRPDMDPRRSPEGSSAFFKGTQGGGGGDRGRGLMGSILPVYAIGILLYFAYIMYKIFLKDKKPDEQTSPAKAQSTLNDFQTQYGPTLERRKAEELQKALSEELKGTKKKSEELKKAQSQGTANDDVDVAALQKRLEDTEKAMQRMMDMMNNMGVAMNQVTKQLCDNKEDDPGQQADDEVSEEGDHLPSGLYEPGTTHSTDTEEDADISNTIDRLPLGDEDDEDNDNEDNDLEEEEEIVEDIGCQGDKEDGSGDTLRKRHVGSNDDKEDVQ